MSTPTTDPPSLPRPQRSRRRGRILFWLLFAICLAALLSSGALLRNASPGSYSEASGGMENTIMPGDVVLTEQAGQVHRGDIIVEEQPAGNANDLLIRRVIGLPGDHVVCCDAQGRMTVNGKSLNETYLYPGDQPSLTHFDVTVPPGEYWLLGDHRSIANDSRYLGPLRITVMGRVILIRRSFDFISVNTPATFVADGLAPASSGVTTRFGAELIVTSAATILLIVLIIFGVTRWVIRRVRRRRERSRALVPKPADTPGTGISSAGG